MKGDKLKGHLDLLVMSILSHGPTHGYAVIEELSRRSNETIDVPEGTLYPVLHRLEEGGYLTSEWSEVKGRRRKVYRLSPSGHRRLSEERRGWATFVAAVTAVTEGTP
ncbi:MAG: helix-turn-helix transcriptional regulator [Propionicimonas sp.]